MSDEIYDLITIGSGPSGLISTLTGLAGIPINPPRHFSGLIIEQFETGEFVKYGKLRVTNRWFFQGRHVIDYLIMEASTSGLRISEKEKVIGVEPGEIKTIRTEKGVYRSRKLSICTGFFPHGNLIKYRNNLRIMFSPVEMEVHFIPKEEGYTIAILGEGEGTLDIARKLKTLRPDLKCLVAMERDIKDTVADLELHSGSIKVDTENENGLEITLIDLQGKEVEKRKCRYMLVDYNSYTLNTRTTDFLKDLGLTMKKGYIVVDSNGNTGLPGVVAAGNIVTPVSGVITALSTGFMAGLNIYTQLYQEKFNKPPMLYPWLPMGDPTGHPLCND